MNLTKDVKGLYLENCKTLNRENKDTNKWKHILCHGCKYLISLKCPYYSKQSIDSIYFCQDTNGVFNRTRTNIPIIYMEPQKTPNSHRNLEKKGRSWRNHAT